MINVIDDNDLILYLSWLTLLQTELESIWFTM